MSIFKAYDIRGVYPSELNEDIAYRVARAMVRFVCGKNPSPLPLNEHIDLLGPARGEGMQIVVGRDHRMSSPALYQAVVTGLLQEGVEVVDVGVVSTPMFNFAVAAYPQHQAGIMITASHNPKEYNGLKLALAGAVPVGRGSGMGEIERLVREMKSVPSPIPSPSGRGLRVRELDVLTPYIDKVMSLVSTNELTSYRAKVVVDPANGLGSIPCTELLKRFSNITLVPLYFELDGTFPNHEANPLKVETLKDLQARVLAEGADLGVAYDGDADRIGFVDEQGNAISIDLMGALLAREVVQQKGGGKVLGDVRASHVVQEEVEKAGGTFLLERVGHAFMKLRMRAEQALAGVELSGHYYWGDFYNFDSTDVAFLLLLSIMAREKKPLSQIMAPFQRYFHSGEMNFTVADKEAKMQEVLAHYKEEASSIETLDGIRLDFTYPLDPIPSTPSWWWFSLRPSNTEPLLRLNVEASTKELMEQKRDELSSSLKS